jgi:hypothetical protein
MTKGNSFRMNDSLSSRPGERRKKFLFVANREEITASLCVCTVCVGGIICTRQNGHVEGCWMDGCAWENEKKSGTKRKTYTTIGIIEAQQHRDRASLGNN